MISLILQFCHPWVAFYTILALVSSFRSQLALLPNGLNVSDEFHPS